MTKHAAEHAGYASNRFQYDEPIADGARWWVDVVIAGDKVEAVVRDTDHLLQNSVRCILWNMLYIESFHPVLNLFFCPDMVLLAPGVVAKVLVAGSSRQ